MKFERAGNKAVSRLKSETGQSMDHVSIFANRARMSWKRKGGPNRVRAGTGSRAPKLHFITAAVAVFVGSAVPLAHVLVAQARPSAPGTSPGMAPAQTIDLVVASVGNAAITKSDVDREYRAEFFLDKDRVPPGPPDPATFERIRDHLIDQRLLAQEPASANIDVAALQRRADERLAKIKSDLGSQQAFDSALKAIGVDEAHLLARVIEQERILQVIDQRLRPLAAPDPSEIEAYYRDTFLPDHRKRNGGPDPPLAEVQGQIREVLVQQKINQQLEVWLKELRSGHQVRIHDANR